MGASVEFDGASGNVNCGSDASLDNNFDGGGTYMAWINAYSAGELTGQIFDKGFLSGGFFYVYPRDETLELNFYRSFSSTNGQWYANIVLNTNQWAHAAVTFDSDSDTNAPLFYQDGILVGTNELAGGAPTGTRTTDAGDNLYIGNNAADSRTFDGKIAYANVYDQILSIEEIQYAMRRPTGIAQGWKMGLALNDSSPHQDWSGNGNTGTATGTTAKDDGPSVSI